MLEKWNVSQQEKGMLISIHRVSWSDGATKAEWPKGKRKPQPRLTMTSRLLYFSYSSPPQNQNNVWQRLKANSISVCFSRWKQYSRGLWVSSCFTFNCKVLIKRVGNLGVRLLRDGWKLCDWTQRGAGLKLHSSKTVLCLGLSFKRDNVRIALVLQKVRLALKKGWSSPSSWHCQYSLLPKPNPVIASAGGGRLDSTDRVRPAALGHHPRTLPCMTNPPRAKESWGRAKTKVKATLCGLVNFFSTEVNNWLFNPEADTHTRSSKLLSPSWIKLPENPWTAKMT